MNRTVLVVADASGCILERLSRAWLGHGKARTEQRLVCAADLHPYTIRRRGESAGMIFWVDPLSFLSFPRAACVPQAVMVHHVNAPEMNDYLTALRSADAVATSSLRWQKQLRELAGIDATLVPYVIDTQVFKPAADRAAVKRSLGLDPGKYVVGFSARAQADAFGRKGIDLFLKVVVAAQELWRDTAVLLIGSGWNDVARSLEQRGIAVVWRRPERTEDTAAFYPAMDVFLCTSNEEGGPCTILEAMACDVPVITTDVGHVPEVVTHGENGFVVGERSASAFMESLMALRRDAALTRRITNAGREFVRARRDQRVVSPTIPFDAMYAEAERRYAQRNALERGSRVLPRSYLGARYVASRIARRRSV
jgi:glycosyltransferase involved in cell wall biosynthesis